MPTAPGFADCSLKFVLSGFIRPAYVTFGVNPSATDPDDVATDVLNCATFAGSITSQLDSSVTLAECTARLGTDGGEDAVGVATSSVLGALVGGAPPPNVAILAHKRTARGGRRGRGRLYMPWFCSANDVSEDGTITPARVTAKQTALNLFRTTLTAEGVPMVLLHSPGKTTAGPPDVVTNITISNVVATQRRRLGR